VGTEHEEVEALLPLPGATFQILLALAEEDRHGYAIMQEVNSRSAGQARLTPGTLYRSIQRMLEQGLIEETDDRPAADLDDERRRYYRITRFGRRAAQGETRRLAQTLKLARACGFASEKA
jgi:DNA-binding PadR family transcriptional regulator